MDPIVQIIVVIITFIAGVYANIFYQKLQSKEILKRNLHNEKLTAYKNVVTSILDLIKLKNKKSKTFKDNLVKLQLTILSNTFILPKDIYIKAHFFAKIYKEALGKEDDFEVDIENQFGELSNLIREDLGISALSKELLDLYKKSPIAT